MSPQSGREEDCFLNISLEKLCSYSYQNLDACHLFGGHQVYRIVAGRLTLIK